MRRQASTSSASGGTLLSGAVTCPSLPPACSYEAAGQRGLALGLAHAALAELLNCNREEVAVLSSATAAWQAVYGLAWGWRRGDRLVTSVAEYGSNYLAYLQVKVSQCCAVLGWNSGCCSTEYGHR